MADRPAAVIFDIDGTLISTGGAGGRAWDRAAKRLYGKPADITEFTDTGMTDPEVATEVFKYVHGSEPTQEQLQTLFAAYLWFIPDEVQGSEGYHVLDGARETLQAVRDAELPVGIVTGALEPASHVKLGRGQLNGYLDFGGFGSDSAQRAEITEIAIQRASVWAGRSLDAAECFVVGDTPKDIEAAHAVGAVAVGVASHKYTREQLAEAGPEHLLDDLTQAFPGL